MTAQCRKSVTLALRPDSPRATGALDNTLVVFISDNGAGAEIMVRGDGHDPHAECGTARTVKGRRIEIQGDQRERIVTELEELAYKVKRVGG